METYIAVLALLVGIGLGVAAAGLARRRQLAGARSRAAEAEAALQDEKLAHAATAATLTAERAAQQQKIAELTALRGEIELKMQSLAGAALEGSQVTFLRLAEQVFARHRENAAEALDQRQKAIEALVAPIRQSLDE